MLPIQAAPPGGPSARVTLARIVRSRGRIGEVAAEILTDFPEHLAQLQRVFLASPGAHKLEREMHVRRCWLHQGRAVFHFQGVDSIEAAEKLRGCEVQAPLSERLELPAGKYYVSDLMGCEVFEVKEGKEGQEVKKQLPMAQERSSTSSTPFTSCTSLGVVRDMAFETGTPLLVIESAHGELLVPFAEDICRRIDVAARRIEITPPEGLLDLNRGGRSSSRHPAG
jgi:16S rRNA processing protein RimM